MATREEAEAMFLAAVRDWDPSSIEIAQDLCIDHGLTLHELGYRASTDPRLETMFPGVNFEGAFVIDDGNGAGWTVALEDSDAYGEHGSGVEVWFGFTGSRYGAGGRFHQWSWTIGRNIAKPTGLALAKAGALEAWAAISAMKQEVEAAKHRGEGPYVYEVKEILFSNKNAERTPPEINPARHADAVEMFWSAVRDWDPSSTEIAQDICIQYGLKLHKLGEDALISKNEIIRAPLLYGGLFEIDEDYSAAWTTRKYSNGYNVEVFFQYGDDFWSIPPDVKYDDTSEERSSQAGAALAWLGLDAMKRVRASSSPLKLHVDRIQNEIRHRKIDQPPPEINPARDLEPNPPWLTTAISDVYDVIQKKVPPEWLPLLSKAHGRGGKIIAEMKEYGCGAYGCVIPTLSHDVVLKATTDKTETEFAAKFSRELVVPIVVEYHMVVALSATHNGQRVSLLWREAADDVGKIKKTKNGRDAVRAIAAQHHAAARVLLAIRDGVANMKVLDNLFAAWIGELDKMAKVPELAYVATGMKRVWLEQKIFIADVHDGNLGKCHRGGKLQWVITDPGNVIVMR